MPRGENFLDGVTATSPVNAWAVGWGGGYGLIEHWDGSSWVIQKSPGVLNVSLRGVSAASPDAAWAVGTTSAPGPVIEHWNGTRWKFVRGLPHQDGDLASVVTVSQTQVWAVGSWHPARYRHRKTLIEYWNGSRWTRQPGANFGRRNITYLTGVAPFGLSDLWAVGVAYVPRPATSKRIGGARRSVERKRVEAGVAEGPTTAPEVAAGGVEIKS